MSKDKGGSKPATPPPASDSKIQTREGAVKANTLPTYQAPPPPPKKGS